MRPTTFGSSLKMTFLSNKEKLDAATLFLARDARKPEPEFVHTLFSGKELSDAANLNLSDIHLSVFMRDMEWKGMVVRTNKSGPDGAYYNLATHVFKVLHKHRANTRFVANRIVPEDGFCLMFTAQKTHRLCCEARNCKFFFDKEKKCVQEKFFIK